ncbi:ferric/cupric-chelate reductase [Entomortierella chlamydospora]|uniref:Ferric/cupric-chelate reductase n=1 Tax=Entomortierella chlamydospora TaxID=101097 RepID=A0A9P6T0C8_9FUNG|nr:ferric/cupric-chelate reductase [Entomortierella chlamydospora]KAG0015751.1 ferric/cupric-chelate reductase [Entomortierella chlamydospora]
MATFAWPYLANPFFISILLCILIPIAYSFADYKLTWIRSIRSNYYYNERDYYVLGLCIAPTVLGHIGTIWGHYYRAEREFQHSIAKVTTPASIHQKISLWERHIWCGFTVKYWIAVFITVALNVTWFVVPLVNEVPKMVKRSGRVSGVGRAIGDAAGYAIVACTGMLLFLVLRRSMLHAIGFTYSEVIPLHRWVGTAIVGWSTLHAIGYIIYLGNEGRLHSDINFYDVGRGTLNMMGVFAYGAVCLLGIFAIPQVRRRFYVLFLSAHRIFTFIFFVGMVMHIPSPMLYYYILPSMILFLTDRFVPEIIQARNVSPEATCSLNVDADIVRVTFTSPEPMKPYYPGDYITIRIPQIGMIYHPFTIASYWPEDPHSMTLFIRTFENKRLSWTQKLAKTCGKDDKRIRVKVQVDGVYGDRRHDYLNSETMIIFVAGAAITTFMALIKAIAAQIAASSEPLRMQLYLICTFRTRSELHAYGSFLHQITRDPRFTSWLHVEIYVSRPDKPQTLMGAHAHVVKNDIQVPSKSLRKEKKKRFMSLKRTGTFLKRALSGRTVVTSENNEKPAVEPAPAAMMTMSESPESSKKSSMHRSDSVHTVIGLDNISEETEIAKAAGQDSEKNTVTIDEANRGDDFIPKSPTRAMTYHDQPLPTFQAANSTSIATKWAKLDLFLTCFIIFVPLAGWCIARSIPWEGSSNWCPSSKTRGTYVTANCRWTYSMIPGAIQFFLAGIIGYLGIVLARVALTRRGSDVEKGLPYPDFATEDERLATEDGNWDEGDVVYSRGRLDVKKAVQEFVLAGVGSKDKGNGLVSVFGGGPDGFVDMVEKHCKNANWSVDFHRETWAP